MTLLVLCLLTIGCKKKKCELYSYDFGYAIGKIQSLTSTLFKVNYKYNYTVDEINFKGKEKTYGIGQKDKLLIGKKFIVINSIANESNSDLNLDYFIESKQDFNNFKSEWNSYKKRDDFCSYSNSSTGTITDIHNTLI